MGSVVSCHPSLLRLVLVAFVDGEYPMEQLRHRYLGRGTGYLGLELCNSAREMRALVTSARW